MMGASYYFYWKPRFPNLLDYSFRTPLPLACRDKFDGPPDVIITSAQSDLIFSTTFKGYYELLHHCGLQH